MSASQKRWVSKLPSSCRSYFTSTGGMLYLTASVRSVPSLFSDATADLNWAPSAASDFR